MEIKNFSTLTSDLDTWIKLEYRDKEEVIIEETMVVGYGVISDGHGDHIEPFYYIDGEILCPSHDAINLSSWEIL